MMVETIAVFHCTAFVGSAWSCAEGIVTTLMDMGHRVLNCGNPDKTDVPIEVLRGADLILLMAPEWYCETLAGRYGPDWLTLNAPKVAWYAESFERDDRTFDFTRVSPLADLHYFPAKQDAIAFGGRWLPFGVDTKIFYPRPVKKQHDVAFLGQMYPKRQAYIARITTPIAFLSPVSNSDCATSFFLLAAAYSSVRIFVNLPSYSRLLVTKVTEVMACRTLLITPEIDHPSGADNHAQFEHGKHLFYYPPDRPEAVGAIVAELLADFRRLDAITEEGWLDVQHNHALAKRLETIIADAAAFSSQAPRRAQAATRFPAVM